MKSSLAAIVDPTPTTQAKTMKPRHQRHLSIKSKAAIESESSDSAEERASKTVDGQGLKSSSKLRSQSFETGQQTTVTNSSLLMPEIIIICQTEHDKHHRAKLIGIKDILQTDVSSSPDTKTKFGMRKVQTQLAEYIQSKLAEFDAASSIESSKTVTRSALQVVKDLKY